MLKKESIERECRRALESRENNMWVSYDPIHGLCVWSRCPADVEPENWGGAKRTVDLLTLVSYCPRPMYAKVRDLADLMDAVSNLDRRGCNASMDGTLHFSDGDFEI